MIIYFVQKKEFVKRTKDELVKPALEKKIR